MRWETCGIAVASLCTAAAGAWAAALSPGLGVGARFDDLRVPGVLPDESFFGTVAPQLGFEAGDGRRSFELFARRRYAYLYQPRVLPPVRPLIVNPDGDLARLRSGGSWGEDASVRVGGDYAHALDPFDAPERSVLTRAGVQRWSGWGNARLGRIEGGYGVEGWDYDRASAPDARALGWNVELLPIRRRDSAVLVGFRQRQLETAGLSQLRAHIATFGFRRTFSPALSGEIELGGAEVEYGDGTRQRGPAFAIELNGPWNDSGAPTARVRVQQDAQTTVSAELMRPVGTGRLSARLESLTAAEGGTSTNALLTRRAGVAGLDTLGRSTVLGFDSSFSRSQPLRFEGPVTDVVRASAWALRRMQPWLDGRATYSYLRQIRPAAGSDENFRRFRLEVGLSAVWH